MKSLLRTAVLATSLLGFAGAGWTAEGKATRVSEHGDWAVFVDKSPKECWSVSPGSYTHLTLPTTREV